jgi:hypothetical protein
MTFWESAKIYFWHYFNFNYSPSSPEEKHQKIINTGRLFSNTTLIETGTFHGDTVFACLPYFDSITSIELSDELHKKATKRFLNNSKVKILHGASEQVLPKVLSQLYVPAVFWLDAHYSMGITAKGNQNTPILEELKLILSHPIKNHIILIDDARCFHPNYIKKFQKLGQHEVVQSLQGYPTMIEILKLLKLHGSYSVSIDRDIIQIYSK